MLFNLMTKCRELLTKPEIHTCEMHREMLEFYSAVYTGMKEA